jgi:hypothetical protein
MTFLRKLSVGVIVLAIGAALGGCTMQSQRDSSIPWAQPTNWESQLPGMENSVH